MQRRCWRDPADPSGGHARLLLDLRSPRRAVLVAPGRRPLEGPKAGLGPCRAVISEPDGRHRGWGGRAQSGEAICPQPPSAIPEPLYLSQCL